MSTRSDGMEDETVSEGGEGPGTSGTGKSDEKVGERQKAPGRKQQCPCGSGRKYKDCCRSPARKRAEPTSAEKIALAELKLMTAAIYV